MSIKGRVSSVKVKDEANPNNVRNFGNATLELTIKRKNDPILVVYIPPNDEIVEEIHLNDCSYVENSSELGRVECIRQNRERRTFIIIVGNNECTDLLTNVREYLTKPRVVAPIEAPVVKKSDAAPVPVPVSNESVNRLLRALNDSNVDEATRIARQLASQKATIRFSLDMINEFGNTKPKQPPKPVVLPIKLKLSIESHLIDNCTEEKFDVAVLPETTIKDLKTMVENDTGIPARQQYWFIKREHLKDDYVFGRSQPTAVENTLLILYIARGQHE